MSLSHSCVLMQRSNLRRSIMSSPTFTTLPREIRDRIYEYVWDLERDVTALGIAMSSSEREFHPFCGISDATLALLHVSHQISTEAAPIFYGKQTFLLDYCEPGPFLNGISLRRHLIKKIEVSWTELKSWSTPQILDLLQNMSGLRSFTIRTKIRGTEEVPRYLDGVDLYKFTDCMNVTLYSESKQYLYFPTGNELTDTYECVVFANVWTCAKGEREWKRQRNHCWVHMEWYDGLASAQPCYHDKHREGWQFDW